MATWEVRYEFKDDYNRTAQSIWFIIAESPEQAKAKAQLALSKKIKILSVTLLREGNE